MPLCRYAPDVRLGSTRKFCKKSHLEVRLGLRDFLLLGGDSSVEVARRHFLQLSDLFGLEAEQN